MSADTIWLGPKEGPSHIPARGDAMVTVTPCVSEEDKAHCRVFGGACAFTRIEPKGLTTDESLNIQVADAFDFAGHGLFAWHKIALRLSAELTAITKERDDWRQEAVDALTPIQQVTAAQDEVKRERERAENAEAYAETLQRQTVALWGDVNDVLRKHEALPVEPEPQPDLPPKS